MSERERWIVYPLLMFALGAAVRDKLMQRVESKEIRCESLQIVDHQDPDRPLAQLSFKTANNNDPTQLADRVGALQLLDSDGNQVCSIATDVLVGRLVARQLLVIDPNSVPRVIVATETQPSFAFDQTGAYSYQGVVYLNNQPVVPRQSPPVNLPPLGTQQQDPPAAQPPAADSPAEETAPPAEKPDQSQ